MTDPTIDDYRRVLRFAGWVEDMIRVDGHTGCWRNSTAITPNIYEHALDASYLPSLLLLDYSVLEKVRGMDVFVATAFASRLDTISFNRWRDDTSGNAPTGPSTVLCQILYGKPGDAIRAALAAGLVEKAK